MQYANLHSFTFPIQRHVDNGKIENLVLSYQNDGSYKVKILKYDLTPQEKVDLELDQLKTIQNPIVTIPIENFDTNLVVNGCEFYTETVYIYCSSGDHSFGNGTGFNCSYWADLSDGTPPRVYTVSKMRCLVDNGGSNGGGDSGVNTGGGATDGDNNYPPEYPTAQTDPEEYEEGISAPVKPSLSAPKSTPCQQLSIMTMNFALKNALADLKTKTGETKEYGYKVTKTNSTFNNPISNNADPNNPNQIVMEAGGNNIGCYHIHPDPATTGTYPMFSGTDIKYLLDVAKFHNNGFREKDFSEYFITLTVGGGTFALKIKDFLNFRRQMDLYYSVPNGIKERLEKEHYDFREPTADINLFKKDFLTVTRYLGIGLYEASSDLSSWSEVVLDLNPMSPTFSEPKNIPCN